MLLGDGVVLTRQYDGSDKHARYLLNFVQISYFAEPSPRS